MRWWLVLTYKILCPVLPQEGDKTKKADKKIHNERRIAVKYRLIISYPQVFPVSSWLSKDLECTATMLRVFMTTSQCTENKMFIDDIDCGTTLYCCNKYSGVYLLVLWVLRLFWALQQVFTVVLLSLASMSDTIFPKASCGEQETQTCRIKIRISTGW